MNIEEVPQDSEKFKDRDKLQKIVYATDKDGNYTSVSSKGWEVENFATKQAWVAIEDEIKEIEAKVKNGELSPVAYYMHKNMLNPVLLAAHTGKWQWQVKRHLKPKIFAGLDRKILEKYAEVFQVSVDELISFGK